MAYVEMSSQGRLLRVRQPFLYAKQKARAGNTRGRIVGLSRSARKRMLDKVATLDTSQKCRFITLTYSDYTRPWRGSEAKANLRALLERMRRAAPQASAIWRMELQDRKSGRLEGVVVPHFHLLVFNADKLDLPDENNPHYSGWFHEAWESITHHHAYYSDDGKHDLRTEDKIIVNERQAMYYVSKYSAKRDDFRTTLVTLSYSHVGRLWGVHNREFLPECPYSEAIVYTSKAAFKAFRAAAEGIWPKLKEMGLNRGFTLYVDDAQRWHTFLKYLIGKYPAHEGGGSLCYNDVKRIIDLRE